MSTEFVIGGIILGLLGVMKLVNFIYIWLNSLHTAEWQAINAEIIESKVFCGATTKRYAAMIKYKYRIGTSEFVSNKIFYGDSLMTYSFDYWENIVIKYQEGSEVKVYYNPVNLTKSVIERGINKIIYRELIFAVICILLSATLLYFAYR